MKKLNNKFGYWLLGWLLMFRHPIKRAIDLGRTAELLLNMEEAKTGGMAGLFGDK